MSLNFSSSRATPYIRADALAPQSIPPKTTQLNKPSSNPTSGRIMLGLQVPKPYRAVQVQPNYSHYGNISLANDPEFQVKPRKPVVGRPAVRPMPERWQPDEDFAPRSLAAATIPALEIAPAKLPVTKSKLAVFTCAQCKKQFSCRFRLRCHQKATTHLGGKVDISTPVAKKSRGKYTKSAVTFDCVQCAKSFSDKRRLYQHQKSKQHLPPIAPLASASVIRSDVPPNYISPKDGHVTLKSVFETDTKGPTTYHIALTISSASSTSHITDNVASVPQPPMCESVQTWVQTQHGHGHAMAGLVLKDDASSICADQTLTMGQPNSALPDAADLATNIKEIHRHLRCVLCGDVCTGQDAYIAHHMTIHPPPEELDGFDSEPGSFVSSCFSSPASGWDRVRLNSRPGSV